MTTTLEKTYDDILNEELGKYGLRHEYTIDPLYTLFDDQRSCLGLLKGHYVVRPKTLNFLGLKISDTERVAAIIKEASYAREHSNGRKFPEETNFSGLYFRLLNENPTDGINLILVGRSLEKILGEKVQVNNS